tara:strand:+ start:64 stop:462 length:399 start_codon:yes stop_codon:yes gene_type:complete
MQAFIGVYFDCVIENSLGQGVIFYLNQDTLDLATKQKVTLIPRLNKAQVLTDYTPILVDGFVFYAVMESDSGHGDWFRECKIIEGKELYLWLYGDLERRSVLHLTFKGVEKGSEFEAWAIANDVPVIDKNTN